MPPIPDDGDDGPADLTPFLAYLNNLSPAMLEIVMAAIVSWDGEYEDGGLTRASDISTMMKLHHLQAAVKRML